MSVGTLLVVLPTNALNYSALARFKTLSLSSGTAAPGRRQPMAEPRRNWTTNHPLAVAHGNEDIKFVEEDESSSEIIGIKTPEVTFTAPEEDQFLQVPNSKPAVEEAGVTIDDNYTEISNASSFLETKIPCPPEKKPSPKFKRSAEIVLNILSRSPSFRKKNRKEYDKVSTREDSTYCSIPEGAEAKEAETVSRRKVSRSSSPDGSARKAGDDDEQILEALRQVVRKCTNPDPLKRPSSNDVFDLVAFYEKS